MTAGPSRLGLLAMARACGWPEAAVGRLRIAGEAAWRQHATLATPPERRHLVAHLRGPLEQHAPEARRARWAAVARARALDDPNREVLAARLTAALVLLAAPESNVREAVGAALAGPSVPAWVRAFAVGAVLWASVGGRVGGHTTTWPGRAPVPEPVTPAPSDPDDPAERESAFIQLDARHVADPARFRLLVLHEVAHATLGPGELLAETAAWLWGAEAATPERYLAATTAPDLAVAARED